MSNLLSPFRASDQTVSRTPGLHRGLFTFSHFVANNKIMLSVNFAIYQDVNKKFVEE
jgi:hypothetical protein